MTNLQEYKLSLFERCESGDITKDERNLLLEAVSEEDEIELEESEENGIEEEDDTELEEAVVEYIDTIEERFNEGSLTEDEVDILLESLASKVKKAAHNTALNAKYAANNIKLKLEDPIHKKYDKLMDKKSAPLKIDASYYDHQRKRTSKDIYRYDKYMDKIGNSRSLSANEKMKKISDILQDKESAQQSLGEYEKLYKDTKDKVMDFESNKGKSTKEKAKYLIGRQAVRTGRSVKGAAKEVANKTSNAAKVLKEKINKK